MRAAALSAPDVRTDVLALADWRRRIATLYSDARSMADGEEAHHHWLTVRSDLFRSHPVSPLPEDARTGFAGIPVFAYEPALRFEVMTTPVEGDVEVVDLGGDGVLTRRPVARTDGLQTALDAELTLYWIEGYGGGLFLPFTDATSGSETYGGGRYLIDAIKGADLGLSSDGRLILDFNFAYHPSCAWNPAWVCPLAPPDNRLPEPVRAGERL